MSDPIKVPERRTTAMRKNPQTLVIVGGGQIGKSSAVAALPDTLLLELQPGGADYLTDVWAMTRERELQTPDAFLAVLDWLKAQRLAGHPVAKRIAIDHLGVMNDWILEHALTRFKRSPRGSGKLADIESVFDIPSANANSGSPGFNLYWQELSMWREAISLAAEETVYIAHLREKYSTRVPRPLGAGEIAPATMIDDIDVVGGKARRVFVAETSAVAFAFRRIVKGADNSPEDQFILNFKSDEFAFQASRCPHLSGREFVVGRSKPGGKPVFDWTQVFLPETTT